MQFLNSSTIYELTQACILADHVVLISIAILVVLFSLQRFGTEKVSFIFAPCVLVWFIFIGGIGIFNIFKHDVGILRAFNPYYIFNYFRTNGKEGWISLGGIVLAITGKPAALKTCEILFCRLYISNHGNYSMQCRHRSYVC